MRAGQKSEQEIVRLALRETMQVNAAVDREPTLRQFAPDRFVNAGDPWLWRPGPGRVARA